MATKNKAKKIFHCNKKQRKQEYSEHQNLLLLYSMLTYGLKQSCRKQEKTNACVETFETRGKKIQNGQHILLLLSKSHLCAEE